MIKRRKVYSNIRQKIEGLFNTRKDNQVIKQNFTKFADISIQNIEKTILASLLDLRAKMFINEENKYLNGDKNLILNDFLRQKHG